MLDFGCGLKLYRSKMDGDQPSLAPGCGQEGGQSLSRFRVSLGSSFSGARSSPFISCSGW